MKITNSNTIQRLHVNKTSMVPENLNSWTKGENAAISGNTVSQITYDDDYTGSTYEWTLGTTSTVTNAFNSMFAADSTPSDTCLKVIHKVLYNMSNGSVRQFLRVERFPSGSSVLTLGSSPLPGYVVGYECSFEIPLIQIGDPSPKSDNYGSDWNSYRPREVMYMSDTLTYTLGHYNDGDEDHDVALTVSLNNNDIIGVKNPIFEVKVVLDPIYSGKTTITYCNSSMKEEMTVGCPKQVSETSKASSVIKYGGSIPFTIEKLGGKKNDNMMKSYPAVRDFLASSSTDTDQICEPVMWTSKYEVDHCITTSFYDHCDHIKIANIKEMDMMPALQAMFDQLTIVRSQLAIINSNNITV